MGGGASKSGFKAKAADAIFDNIDRNNDGKLSVYELASAASRGSLKKVWPDWLIEETIARYDEDGDQMLNKEEWAKAFSVLTMPADKIQKKKENGFLLVPLRASDEGDRKVLSTLRQLLVTDPKNLGHGKDCAKWGPYDRLHLARAWRVDNDGEAAKYGLGREEVKDDLGRLKDKGKAVPQLSVPIHTASACTAPARTPRLEPAPAPCGRWHAERAQCTISHRQFALAGEANEAVLFHGLPADSLWNILSTGLNERTPPAPDRTRMADEPCSFEPLLAACIALGRLLRLQCGEQIW